MRAETHEVFLKARRKMLFYLRYLVKSARNRPVITLHIVVRIFVVFVYHSLQTLCCGEHFKLRKKIYIFFLCGIFICI